MGKKYFGEFYSGVFYVFLQYALSTAIANIKAQTSSYCK